MANLPDMFLVFGTDKYGEPFRSEEKTEDMAQHVAERINRRGGNVAVKRFVFDGPAARWIDPERRIAQCPPMDG